MSKSENTKNNFVDGTSVYIHGEFDSDFNEHVIAPFNRLILTLREKRSPVINIYINSNGGYCKDLDSMLAQIDIARANGIIIRTIVTGQAYSCGSMLAMYGDKGERYISRNAEHLIHYGRNYASVTTPEQIDRNTAYMKRHFKRLLALYQEHSKVPNLEEKIKDDDLYIPPDKCIKWGLADKYIEEIEL